MHMPAVFLRSLKASHPHSMWHNVFPAIPIPRVRAGQEQLQLDVRYLTKPEKGEGGLESYGFFRCCVAFRNILQRCSCLPRSSKAPTQDSSAGADDGDRGPDRTHRGILLCACIWARIRANLTCLPVLAKTNRGAGEGGETF